MPSCIRPARDEGVAVRTLSVAGGRLTETTAMARTRRSRHRAVLLGERHGVEPRLNALGERGCRVHFRPGLGVGEHRLEVCAAAPLRVVGQRRAVQAAVDVRRHIAGPMAHRGARGGRRRPTLARRRFSHAADHARHRPRPERRGLLARAAAPGRGRARAAELTAGGDRVLERADAAVRAIERRMTVS